VAYYNTVGENTKIVYAIEAPSNLILISETLNSCSFCQFDLQVTPDR